MAVALGRTLCTRGCRKDTMALDTAGSCNVISIVQRCLAELYLLYNQHAIRDVGWLLHCKSSLAPIVVL